MTGTEITQPQVDKLYQRLGREAEAGGYHLNPEVDFTKNLVKSLLINEQRYGYRACPCRLASGNKEADLDITCPCDYRDPDLNDYDACFCALYVSGSALRGEREIVSIPERRPPPEERTIEKTIPQTGALNLSVPVWRCRVCGYLCGREQPPEVCPVCRAEKGRFEQFIRAP